MEPQLIAEGAVPPTQPEQEHVIEVPEQPAKAPKSSKRTALPPGDIEILKHVYDYRLLRIRNLEALIGRDYNRLHDRFKLLLDNGYLGRHEFPWKKDVYYIRRKGLVVLLREGLITDEEAERRVRTGELKSEQHIDHELMISDIHLMLGLAERSGVIKLVTWKQEREIHDSFEVTVHGEREVIKIEPDAFFTIGELSGPPGQRQIRSYLLEADRMTMSKKERPGSRRMDEKVRKYKHFIAENRPRNHETFTSLNVGFVRTLTAMLTRRRRDSLAESAAKLLAQSDRKWFFFGALDDLSFENPRAILDPVFLWPGEREARRQLLPPVAQKPSHA